MTWPVGVNLDLARLDEGTDRPPREVFLQLAQTVQQMADEQPVLAGGDQTIGGKKTFSQPPVLGFKRALLKRTTTQEITAGVSYVQFNQLDAQHSNWTAQECLTADGRFLAPETGLYMVLFRFEMYNSGSTTLTEASAPELSVLLGNQYQIGAVTPSSGDMRYASLAPNERRSFGGTAYALMTQGQTLVLYGGGYLGVLAIPGTFIHVMRVA